MADRRLGCDVRVDTVSAIAMITAKITGATINAIVVLVAMISGLGKAQSSGPRQPFSLRPAFPFTIYFLLAILIRPPVHKRMSAAVQLLSKI